MSTPTPPPAPHGTDPATPPAPPATTPGGDGNQPPAPPAAAADTTDWKAEARKWEQRAKEHGSAAKKLAELEDAQKTEAQKLADRATTAEKDAAASKAEALRWRTAARHGISDEDAEIFLTGTTEEVLSRQAERLVALRTPQPPAGDQPPAGAPPAGQQRTPVEALRPGALPSPPEPTLADQIAAAEKSGDWATAHRLKAQQLVQLANPNQ